MRTTIWQIVSIGLGGALLALQTWLLFEHATHSSSLSPALLAAVPVVTVTLAVLPILIEHCLRRRAWVKALGLTILFGLLVGTSLPQAIGRAGETRDARIAEAQASTRPMQLATDELNRTLARIEDAEREVKRECNSGAKGFGPKCEGWRRTLSERLAAAASLRADIARLEPAKTGPADAPRIAAVLGVSQDAVNLYQPMFLPLAIEIGVWMLLWLGCSPTLARRDAPVARPIPVASTGGDDPVVVALRRAGRPLSNGELAREMRVSDGEASKRIKALAGAGVVRKGRVGRSVRVTLH